MKQPKVALLIVVLVLLGVTAKISFTSNSKWEALYDEATAYSLKEEYAEAVRASVESLSAAQAELGASHLDVAKILNNLGVYYGMLGDNSKAEHAQLRSLQITEELLGSEHSEVFFSLSNLRATYVDTGKCDKAKKLLKRMTSLKLKHKSKLPPLFTLKKCKSN